MIKLLKARSQNSEWMKGCISYNLILFMSLSEVSYNNLSKHCSMWYVKGAVNTYTMVTLNLAILVAAAFCGQVSLTYFSVYHIHMNIDLLEKNCTFISWDNMYHAGVKIKLNFTSFKNISFSYLDLHLLGAFLLKW